MAATGGTATTRRSFSHMSPLRVSASGSGDERDGSSSSSSSNNNNIENAKVVEEAAKKEQEKDDDVFTIAHGEEGEEELEEENSAASTKPPADAIRTGEAEAHDFQAETKKLLDIVTHSLYSEKDVFVRELVSNCADALEKLRYLQKQQDAVADADLPLEIRIFTDKENGTLTISDTGIGMAREEMIENLGTIARSGSKAFVEKLAGAAGGGGGGDARDNIIGQFGVGFYASFMVGDRIVVTSRSADPEAVAHEWISDGSGRYEIAPVEGAERGTSIKIHLREGDIKYADDDTIKDIIRRYSNFVGFPVSINGKLVNTVEPLWTKAPSQVTEEQHEEFYSFIAKTMEKPRYHLHYSVDAPLMVRSVLYVPDLNMEKFGFGRMEPGVSLYARRVLIQGKVENMLPAWLRFVRGVVDSEDIPLNLSREMMQDSALVGRIGRIITTRFIKFLQERMRVDAEKYAEFYEEYSSFIREGVYSDHANREEIMKLMLCESSTHDAGKTTSLAEYVERMPDDQEHIYYLIARNRDMAEASPYMEVMQANGTEVLYLYDGLDDAVMSNARTFGGKSLVSVETSKVEAKSDLSADKEGALDQAAQASFREWLQDTLGSERVKEVKVSSRLVNTPAILTDHQSSSHRQMMRMLAQGAEIPDIEPQVMEINPAHPLIVQINEARQSSDGAQIDVANKVAHQLFDNVLLNAGILDEPRAMIGRLEELMSLALESNDGDK